MKLFIMLLMSFHVHASENCASPDAEPALESKSTAGPILKVCGFEDHEVVTPKGRRTFADFVIYAHSDKIKTPLKVFASEPDETYWLQPSATKGLEIEELWFFTDKPVAGLKREITCTVDACTLSEPKCIYKAKKNPFPKALANFKKKPDEESVDQIFAQALGGDKAAKEFYVKRPEGLTPELVEAYDANQKKLALGCQL